MLRAHVEPQQTAADWAHVKGTGRSRRCTLCGLLCTVNAAFLVQITTASPSLPGKHSCAGVVVIFLSRRHTSVSQEQDSP